MNIKNIKIINCTPHNVAIESETGLRMEIPRSGTVPRVQMTTSPLAGLVWKDDTDNILKLVPVSSVTYGEVQGLPPQVEGVVLVVSTMVADALRGSGRTDIYVPDSGPDAIRFPKDHPQAGQVEAVRRLLYRGA